MHHLNVYSILNLLFQLVCLDDDDFLSRSWYVCRHLLRHIGSACDGLAHPHHREQLRRVLQRPDEEGEVAQEEAGLGAGHEGRGGGATCGGKP